MDEPDKRDWDESDKFRRERLDNKYLVSIFVKNGGKISMFFNPLTVNVQKVMNEVCDITSIPLDEFKLLGVHSGQVWNPNEPLRRLQRDDGLQAYLVLKGLSGGARGRPVKKFLKKEEAMVELQNRVKKNLRKDVDEPSAPPTLEQYPETFRNFIAEMKAQTSTLSVLQTRVGQSFVNTCLHQIDISELKCLKEIIKPSPSPNQQKGRHMTVEEKVRKGLTYIYPALTTLDNAWMVIAYHTLRIFKKPSRSNRIFSVSKIPSLR